MNIIVRIFIAVCAPAGDDAIGTDSGYLVSCLATDSVEATADINRIAIYREGYDFTIGIGIPVGN